MKQNYGKSEEVLKEEINEKFGVDLDNVDISEINEKKFIENFDEEFIRIYIYTNLFNFKIFKIKKEKMHHLMNLKRNLSSLNYQNKTIINQLIIQ